MTVIAEGRCGKRGFAWWDNGNGIRVNVTINGTAHVMSKAKFADHLERCQKTACHIIDRYTPGGDRSGVCSRSGSGECRCRNGSAREPHGN